MRSPSARSAAIREVATRLARPSKPSQAAQVHHCTSPEATRREDANVSAPLVEITDGPPTPNPAETDALHRSFGTRTPRQLRPAAQDNLFDPAPQMRLSFQAGDN